MTEKAANNDNDLFANIDMGDFENDLLTVDVGEDQEVIEEVKTVQVEGDDPAKEGAQEASSEDPSKSEKKVVEKPPSAVENLIDVDSGGSEPDTQAAQGETTKSKEEGSTQKTESESPVYLHAAALQENGVLPNFDLEALKELEPADAILKMNEHIQTQVADSIKEGVDEYKSTLAEPARKFIEDLERGVPFEAAADNYTLSDQFEKITEKHLESDEDLQKQVYENFLAMKGFSDTKIKKLVESAEQNEELFNESKDALTDIKTEIKREHDNMVANAEREKEAREKRNTETKEKLQETVNGIKEIIPGIAVSEDERKEIFKMLTVPAEFQKLPNGQERPVSTAMSLRSKDPIAYEVRLNYLINKGFFEKDLKNLKLETFLKKQETSATKKLIERMNGEKPAGGGETTVKSESEKKKDDSFVFPQSLM